MSAERVELIPDNSIMRISPERRRRINWLALSVEQRVLLIEREAQNFLITGFSLTHGELIKAKKYHLIEAIGKYYPGGINQLKEAIGIKSTSKPKGYWNPETIEKEALSFYQEAGILTQQALQKAKKGNIGKAIPEHYPGGMLSLKEKLGLPIRQKPYGYWTPDKIEQEAREFLVQKGEFTVKLLKEAARYDLLNYVRKYPGGMFQLKLNLGLKPSRTPRDFWTLEQIEVEARNFFQEEGNLSSGFLSSKKRNDLRHAIRRYYPGGMSVLRSRLDIQGEKSIPPDEANEQLRRLLEDYE